MIRSILYGNLYIDLHNLKFSALKIHQLIQKFKQQNLRIPKNVQTLVQKNFSSFCGHKNVDGLKKISLTKQSLKIDR
jgi:hypothetical protein